MLLSEDQHPVGDLGARTVGGPAVEPEGSAPLAVLNDQVTVAPLRADVKRGGPPSRGNTSTPSVSRTLTCPSAPVTPTTAVASPPRSAIVSPTGASTASRPPSTASPKVSDRFFADETKDIDERPERLTPDHQVSLLLSRASSAPVASCRTRA